MTNTAFVLKNIFVRAAVAVATTLAVVGIARASVLPGVEVTIKANGDTLVRGAEVTAVSGSNVSARTSLGSSVMNWLVTTDSNTEFSATNDGARGLANIGIGDSISFRGSIDQSLAGLTVKAKHVKEWTKSQAKQHIRGTVTSINSSLNSFVITDGNETTTVQTNGSTKFSTNGSASTFAGLFVTANVKVLGMINASSTVFTATDVRVSSSTKEKWNKDDARAWRNWIRSKAWLNFQ